MIPIRYNVRNLASRRATTLATVAGIGLVVFVLTAVLMFADGLHSSLKSAGRSDVAIVLSRGSGNEVRSGLGVDRLAPLLAPPEVTRGPDGAPVGVGEIVVALRMGRADRTGSGSVQIRGVPDGAVAFRHATFVAGRAPRPGAGEAAVGRGLRGKFENLEVDQSITLPGGRSAPVVGVFETNGSVSESEVWVDLEAVRTAYGLHGHVSSLRVQLRSSDDFSAYRAAAEGIEKDALRVVREDDYFSRQGGGMNLLIQAIALIIALMTAAGATLGAMITMYTSVAQRRREIGTLRAIGFPRSAVLTAFVFESVLVSLLGSIPGLLGALALSRLDVTLPNASSGTEISIPLQLSPTIVVAALLATAVMGVVGGLLPAVAAARVRPVEALRD